MAQTMTPSELATRKQAGELLDRFGVALQKAEFQKDSFQRVLEMHGAQLTEELVAVVRKFLEVATNTIVRIVKKVNRNRTPQEALNATGRQQYVDRNIVDTMPRGEGEKVEIVLFKIDLVDRGRYISDDELEKEFKLRDLVPVDPFSLMAVNEEYPAFADDHPNATHWKDASGNWCYSAFGRWFDGGRDVSVSRSVDVWYAFWWFGGVRKY